MMVPTHFLSKFCGKILNNGSKYRNLYFVKKIFLGGMIDIENIETHISATK